MGEITSRWKEQLSEFQNWNCDCCSFRSASCSICNWHATLPGGLYNSIAKLHVGKANGLDGLFAEIFRFGRDHLADVRYSAISDTWTAVGEVPKESRYTIWINQYRDKGNCQLCGSYRGIALLYTTGNIFCGTLISLSGYVQNESAAVEQTKELQTWCLQRAKYTISV